MKYISEVRLRELINSYIDRRDSSIGTAAYQLYDDTISTLRMVLNESKELDNILISKLRPMRDAPRNGDYIRAYLKNHRGHIKEVFVRWNKRCNAWEEYMVYVDDDMSDLDIDVFYDRMFEGWIPLPVYKPEQ